MTTERRLHLRNRANAFQLLIVPRGDCWEWRGNRTRRSMGGEYGVFAWFGEPTFAHRLAYEIAKGSIPPGVEIDHLCRHSWCVRPTHLEAVSHRENTLRGDSIAARNAVLTHCRRGHPFDAANTIHRRSTERECRACKRERRAAYYRTHPELREQGRDRMRRVRQRKAA